MIEHGVTMDYNKFKMIGYSREANTSKLEKSISECDLTPYSEILVTKDFYIIEGQHRFAVCKKFGLPIYYKIYDGNAPVEKVMTLLNNNVRTWKYKDWLHFYVTRNYSAYIKLQSVLDNHKISISNAVVLFSNGKTDSARFKEGKLVDDSYMFEDVYNFINSTSLPSKIKEQRDFNVAVLRFLIKYKDNPKKINKLAKNILTIERYLGADRYLNAFENLT